ncbi:uncharacterized protein LY89DRAFT_740472 [Mollisia scopiformis]|uniref:Uncharacterized protein n=1 Tax=Mollisia scopiformis TaxID=149040 RepID=A0A132BE07_MOLSC|nr:uncharacterized protein LY89DRAFT_740472 [Mollisia scopiformis]KUJ10074.1 hypothetical protein LY89DRAFT_740472 [Mollisia scopiformis]
MSADTIISITVGLGGLAATVLGTWFGYLALKTMRSKDYQPRFSTPSPPNAEIDLESWIQMPTRPPQAHLTWSTLQRGKWVHQLDGRSNTWS